MQISLSKRLSAQNTETTVLSKRIDISLLPSIRADAFPDPYFTPSVNLNMAVEEASMQKIVPSGNIATDS